MNKVHLIIMTLFFLCNIAWAQTERLIPIEKYFSAVDSLEFEKIKAKGLINDENNITPEYLDLETNGLNTKGWEKYLEVKTEVFIGFFKDLLLLQSLNYKDDVYALYFSVAGFDDVEFQILRWNNKDWIDAERIDKRWIELPNQNFELIAFNYDEGPKNLDNVRIFIENDFLVLERSALYHSLYDLASKQLIFNEESPWHAAQENGGKEMNDWIKENLHDKIKEKIKQVKR